MGLINIFSKKTASSLPKAELRTSDQKIRTAQDSFFKSRDLLQQATNYKDKDIVKAISLIKEAIHICPESVSDDQFKLADYYHIANNKEKAFETLHKLLYSFDINDITMFNQSNTQVYDKLCNLSYKDKNYENYLQYYCFWIYNVILADVCQGRKNGLKSILDNRDKLDYLAPTRVKGSFQKLDKVSIKQEFNNKLVEFFNRQREALTEMVNKTYEAFNSAEIRVNESSGQRNNRLMQRDSKFMINYKNFNNKQFKDFFKNDLNPLLK